MYLNDQNPASQPQWQVGQFEGSVPAFGRELGVAWSTALVKHSLVLSRE